ncbi:MAG: substrate-binding domain-containing protein [Verrucomicrobiota bacterium]|nr:helix-turn-helix domain-containing protein [Limisphaerales bacterium]
MRDSLPAPHPVLTRRLANQWSQVELAGRAGISRAAVNAIEGERLLPSIATALALAAGFKCSVEELLGRGGTAEAHSPEWAWTPRVEPCRYWEAEIGGRRLLYPVEGISLNCIPPDGVWPHGFGCDVGAHTAETTLILSCWDPAAGLLATEYARASGFRLIVLSRGSSKALDLLIRGLVHIAGLHRTTQEQPNRNAEPVRLQLGGGYRLVRVAQWQEGLALAAHNQTRSTRSVARSARCRALREAGSAARECLDELRAHAPGRTRHSDTAVAEPVRDGWADADVCVQLAAEEAGLNFLPVHAETLDFCYSSASEHDPRIQALIRLLHSRSYRRLVGDLPGGDARRTGETIAA